MKRSPSAGMGFEPNRNTEWLDDRFFFVWYALLILFVALALHVTLFFVPIFPDKYIWTAVHMGHTVISFVMMHWWKGTPFQLAEDQGRYDQDTFWEQIDHGRQGTKNRRVFTTIPLILFLLASYMNHWNTEATIVNVIFLLIAVVPKIDSMDHVRLGGINQD